MLVRLSWLPWLLWLTLNGIQSRIARRARAGSGKDRTIKEPQGARPRHLAALAGAALLLLPFPHLGPLQWRWLSARARWQVLGLLFEVASLSFATWARAALGRYWTGRVALSEDQTLVTHGPYRLVRHPIYTGLLGGMLGSAVVQGQLRGLGAFALLVAAYGQKTSYEEAALREHFGTQYERYAAKVPAFLPHLPQEAVSEMSVDVHGDIDRLWQLAANVPHWADILPHYRYITVLMDDGPQRTVVMAARRGMIPISWTSTLALDPVQHRIFFEHVGGKARGMLVEWRIVQHNGFVRATIWHDLRHLKVPIVASRLGRYILADQFIEPIARRTLGCMKSLVETEPFA